MNMTTTLIMPAQNLNVQVPKSIPLNLFVIYISVVKGLKQTKKYIRHTNIQHPPPPTESMFAGILTLGFSLIQCTDGHVTFDNLAGLRNGLEAALAIAFKRPANRERLEFNP
jgi:hypothetical protein